MRKTSRWVVVLSLLVSVLVLAACSAQPKGPAAPQFTDDVALDILWKYEQALTYKLTDPATYVTGTEKQWLDQFLADKQAGKQIPVAWKANGALIRVVKAGAKESTASSDFFINGQQYVVQFRFVPVDGAWKIENHQTLEGKWWAPAK